MASSITLSAGVRQNLLSLQNTADLAASTQNRLATGKKVNSALDNPTSFFTSSSLQNRANDLNDLLDNIGQAQKTLDAANQGLTSLTSLVQSAKSIAKQARQASLPSAVTYGAVSGGGTAQAETLGTTGDGSAITVANSTTYSFDVNFNGGGAQTVTYTSDGTATYAEVLAGLQSSFASAATAEGLTAGTDVELVANAGGDGIKINALQADVDTVITANSGAGLTNATYASTSLLDNIVAAGGAAGNSLNVSVNGGTAQQITFGTGVGQISKLSELNTALAGLTGVTASASGTGNRTIAFAVAGASTQTSLGLTTTNAATATALGLTQGTTNGTATTATPDATRTSLQSDFNNLLTQIDQLAKDSSYNGVNLLNGDQLKVTFNEKGTSSLTIAGVTLDSGGLGLSSVSGTGASSFQDNTKVDEVITSLDTALTSLRTQASKFGSNLTTVQTRQDFTKNLITTLQSGADQLVLADTNLEGANLLALQTRQQLSTTALSLANQASQAVLRLF